MSTGTKRKEMKGQLGHCEASLGVRTMHPIQNTQVNMEKAEYLSQLPLPDTSSVPCWSPQAPRLPASRLLSPTQVSSRRKISPPGYHSNRTKSAVTNQRLELPTSSAKLCLLCTHYFFSLPPPTDPRAFLKV